MVTRIVYIVNMMIDQKYKHLSGLPWKTNNKGYPRVILSQHQLVWLFEYGFLPEPPLSIDHINGDPSDNRLENLRIADVYQQLLNRRCFGDLSFVGVYYNKRKKWYEANFTPRGETRITIRNFETPEAAAAVSRDLCSLFYLSDEDKSFLVLNYPERKEAYENFLASIDRYDKRKTAIKFIEEDE